MNWLTNILFSRYFYIMCFLLSSGTMIVIDYILGDKAEFLNAWYFIRIIFKITGEESLQFIYMQDKLGSLAIPAMFCLLLFIHGFISFVLTKCIRMFFS